jgi:Cu(I)/Ag(I) efflux system membrane fusion protein
MFDTYESDIPWVKMGDEIQFTIKSLPGKTFTGKVTFIDPVINPKTRVAYVRTELNNPRNLLKPGMFVSGILKTMLPGGENALVIPKSSILWTGKRAVVYVKDPDKYEPTFEYREIVLGEDAGNYYVVKEGLEEGEEIVTNGVFSIDAAAQLRGKSSMMSPKGGKVSTGHNHAGMDMGQGSDKEMEKKADQPGLDMESMEVPVKFKKQLNEVVNKYFAMKDAFADSDEAEVEAFVKNMLDVLNKVDMGLLEGDAHNNWMELLRPIKENLNGIIQMKGIEMKRSHFSIVSNKLTEAVDIFGVASNQPLYLVFCPMAFDNKGAFWISADKEIRNPYFGDKMLKCGEVKRKFK